MENLLQALTTADGICNQANAYFEKEANLLNKVAVEQGRSKKALTVAIIAMFFVSLIIINNLNYWISLS